MNKKIIFFDIDGTIIGEESHVMLESTKKAILKARENGHICIVNTGRSQKLVGKNITDLVEFDGYVMGCGTMAVYHGQELMHETFSREMADRIVDGLKRHKIDAVLEGKENNYNDALEKCNTKLFHDFLINFKDMGYGSWEEASGNFDKFYAYVEDVSRMEAFQAEFEEELDFIDREHGFYEIMPKNHSKASGIKFLAEKLSIPMEDTVAIGDSNNDITMLECVNTSIAMGNSSKAVLEMADYITTDVDEDGIWNALEWLGVLTD